MSQTVHQSQSLLSIVGTENNPIDILDQSQEKNLYDNFLEMSRNQEIIKKALLCKTSLDIVFAIIMTKFPGQFMHKEECLKKEIVRYFYDKLKINILYQSFTPRFQPDYSSEDTKPFGIALMVHGVDFLDTRQIGKMFSSPIEGSKGIIQKITWINDSNAEIVFFNPQVVQTVIQRLNSDVKKNKVKIQEESSTQLTREWFQLNSYNINGINRKIFARYTTTLQLNLKKTSQLSRYTIFENAQKGLELYLLTKFQAFEDFQNIMKQIEYETYRKSVLSQSRYFHGIKPSFGNQHKLDQYMSEGKKPLNLKLNFQGHHERPKNHSLRHKAQETVEVMQGENHLDISVIERNEKNVSPKQIHVNDISLIENKENAMVNEEDENVPINNILTELNKDTVQPMISEEAQKSQAMLIEKPAEIQVEKSEIQLANTNKTDKVEASFSNEKLMNLLRQMNQISSVTGEDKLAINPENIKLLLSQLNAKPDTTKEMLVQKQQKQKEVITNTPKEIIINTNQSNLVVKNVNQENKKQTDLQNYDPLLLQFTQKNENNLSESKGNNMNSANRGGYQDKGYKQTNQAAQKPASGDYKSKPAVNNYQKNQSKALIPGDDFYEPTSY